MGKCLAPPISEHNRRNSVDRDLVATIFCEKLPKELNHVIGQPHSLACPFQKEYAGASIGLSSTSLAILGQHELDGSNFEAR